MPVWTEIRPPTSSEPVRSDTASRLSTHWRSLAGWLPAIVALALVLVALGLLAGNQSATGREPDIRFAELPTESRPSLIDLNSATIAEISTLLGIGDTRARAIVLTRSERPLRSFADLADRGILRPSEILAIAEFATVYVAGD